MTDPKVRLAPGGAGWTDAHCHLQGRYLGDGGPEDGAPDDAVVRATLERAAAAGVTRAVCVGTDVASSREAVRLANLEGLAVDLYATVGLHPHEASTSTRGLEEVLDGASRVVAIGECGLDYYYEHSPRDAQLDALREQLALAVAHDLAVVLHVREAFEDLFSVLEATGVPPRTIVHCFSAGPSEASQCLEAGMAISIAGIVTFKSADALREAVTLVPLDRLLVETDSPFLAPVPHRGRPNEPAHVAIVGEAVAKTLNLDPEVVQASTSANASRLFRCVDPS